MKFYQATIMVLFLTIALAGCIQQKTEKSEILTEEATVDDLVYTPSRHGSVTGPTISMNGKLGMAFTDVDIPQKYAVVFECAHGKFIVERNQRKAKELWQRLKRGQKVVISYHEVYVAKYDGDRLMERRLKDYYFLDAK